MGAWPGVPHPPHLGGAKVGGAGVKGVRVGQVQGLWGLEGQGLKVSGCGQGRGWEGGASCCPKGVVVMGVANHMCGRGMWGGAWLQAI